MARPKRDDVAVKISTRIYRKAKIVAAYLGVSLAEYLSDLLEKPVDRDHTRMLRESREQEQEEKDGGPRP